VSGETWQFIKPGVSTSNGAADGTTIIDTGGDSGGARTYNGQYWVEITSGALQGKWARVVEDDGLGSLVFENNGFEAQVVSGVGYKIWKSPEPVFTVTTSTSTTQFTCSARTEADDFWIGYECMVIYASDNGGTSPLRSEIQTISDSTNAGVITVDTAFSNQPRVGDVLLIGKFVEFSGLAAGPTNEYLPRPGNRINFSMGDGVVGPRGGTIGFNTHVRPSGSLAGDQTVATKTEISGLFQATGLVENQDTTQTIPNGDSTTTTLEIPAASEETFTVGNMVIVNSEARFITSKGDGTGTAAVDQIVVTPALSVAPASGDIVYATCGYHKSTDGDVYGVCVEIEQDGLRHTYTGCKGSVQLVDGVAPEMNWTFNVDHYVRQVEAAPYANITAYSAAKPVLAKDRIAYSSTTAVSVAAFTATPGTVVVPKPIQGAVGLNGRAGYQLTNFAARATWSELLDSSSATLPRELEYQVRTSKDIIVILTADESSIFGCRIPVARQVEAPHPGDQDGLLSVPVVWEAQDAGQFSASSVTTVKVPDFSFHLS
jgi:hypothetical protein